MSYKAEFLSQAEVCAIYQCLDGHIHLKYRTLDITMDACDFHQVAESLLKPCVFYASLMRRWPKSLI